MSRKAPDDRIVEQLRELNWRLERAERAVREAAAPAPRPEPLTLDPNARYDRLGRKQPTQGFTALTLLRAVPGLAGRFDRRVPPDFVAVDVERGERCAVVACPCGSEPRVRVNRIVGCDCDRTFLFTGDDVLVASEAAPGPDAP